MERIREAIERAKASRGGGGAEPGETAVMDAPPPKVASKPEFRPLPSTPAVLDRRHLEAMRVFAFDPADPRTTSFDMLRTKVVQTMADRGFQTLIVTSPRGGCGKTFTAINLALSIARQPDRSVVLVDLDIRKPQVASCLGLEPGLGLLDVLKGQVDLSEALVSPDLGGPRFLVLPGQRAPHHLSEALVSRELKNLVSHLKSQDPSHIVIFDMPPVLSTDDVMAFLPQADAVLLIAAVGSSTTAEIAECEQNLESTNLLGIVLNKSTEPHKGYYY